LNVNRRIPVSFQKLEKFEIKDDDTRFLPVKIWLMHLGENLNGSYFSKEVVESAIPSLSNTPIMAYLEENSDEELDFSDHRQVLVVKNDTYDVKYLGQAIGIIPESNNAQFEERECEDGVTRTFLTVEGYIWTKWDDPVDILNRDSFKAQSMELHSDYEGFMNEEDGLFHFTNFKFFGACGLGKEVLPAMMNSTIETNFNLDIFKQEIQDKMEQLKFALSKINDRGGKESMDAILKLLEKYSLNLEDLTSKEINHEEYSLDELEDKIKEVFTKNNFTLTSEQLEDELKRELKEIEVITEEYWGETYSYPRFYFIDYMPEQMIVIASDCKEDILVGFKYNLANENVEVDATSGIRYKVDYVPMNLDGGIDNESDDKFSKHFTNVSKVDAKLKEKELSLTNQFNKDKEIIQGELEKLNESFSKLQEDYSSLETTSKELEQFKSTVIKEQRETAENEIFERFSDELTVEEMNPIREKSAEFSLEEIEDKLFALAGRKKVKFSTTNKQGRIKMGLFQVNDDPQQEKDVWTEQKEKFGSNQ
jgi:hypothetical protein